jgi:hypothetical protein
MYIITDITENRVFRIGNLQPKRDSVKYYYQELSIYRLLFMPVDFGKNLPEFGRLVSHGADGRDSSR